MIRPEELRIGNYIQTDSGLLGEIFNITRTTVRIFVDNELEDLMPRYEDIKLIQLTEQWLLDFGFEKKDEFYEKWISNLIYSYEFGKGLCFGQGMEFSYDIKCEYVHELQNLIKSLTGQELKLNR